MSECKLMAHLVAGYPDLDASVAAAGALAAGGADYIEVQFPFSDPSSDGPVIERACQEALAGGFKVGDGFAMMKLLAGRLDIPLFIMTYGSLVFARGVEAFVEQAAAAGVHGLIVPDLPPDYDERLFASGRAAGVAVVPVIAPEISAKRLELIDALRPEFVYTALRLGITGNRTALGDDALRHLDRVAALGAKVVAGFGVASREQMLALSGHAHAAAVGSHFLRRLQAEGFGNIEKTLSEAAMELKGKIGAAG